MCDCVYTCTIIVVGMYKNHCLVASAIMVGESAILCMYTVCLHITYNAHHTCVATYIHDLMSFYRPSGKTQMERKSLRQYL